MGWYITKRGFAMVTKALNLHLQLLEEVLRYHKLVMVCLRINLCNNWCIFWLSESKRLHLASLCIHKGILFIYRQTLFRELQCLIETDKDAFETITILVREKQKNCDLNKEEFHNQIFYQFLFQFLIWSTSRCLGTTILNLWSKKSVISMTKRR